MDEQENVTESQRPLVTVNTTPGTLPPITRGRSPRRKLAPLALAVLIAAGALVLWHPWNRAPSGAPMERGGHPGRGSLANQAQPVQVASATRGDMPIVLNTLGTVTPLATVTVKTQLAGTLQSVGFQEGQMVKKGDVLAQIDPRPYQISLDNAQGVLIKDQALLQTARVDLKRYQTLLAQDSIASQQVDTQASLVKQYEGQVKSDQASIDTYKLDLTYARITAPVSGRVGLRQVDPGNYVTPSDTNGIVVITQLQPISVIFTTSEDNLPAIMKHTSGSAKLSVTAYDRNNTTALETGHLDTFDNQIDTTTGTVKLRALLPNISLSLFPNQFVNARLLVNTVQGAVIVPTSAVLNGASGPFVYVVKPDNTVTVRQIKPGPVDGERTSVASGLEVGERVVVDGSDRLNEGAKITIPAEHPQGASAAHAGGASGAHGGQRRHAANGAGGQ